MKGLPNNSLENILENLASGVIDGDDAKERIALLIRKNNKRKENKRDDNSHSNADCYGCNMDADFAFADL